MSLRTGAKTRPGRHDMRHSHPRSGNAAWPRNRILGGNARDDKHDQELAFKVTARRNKLLGPWAAEHLDLVGAMVPRHTPRTSSPPISASPATATSSRRWRRISPRRGSRSRRRGSPTPCSAAPRKRRSKSWRVNQKRFEGIKVTQSIEALPGATAEAAVQYRRGTLLVAGAALAWSSSGLITRATARIKSQLHPAMP